LKIKYTFEGFMTDLLTNFILKRLFKTPPPDLSPCSSMVFEWFLSNPPSSFPVFPSTNQSLAKLTVNFHGNASLGDSTGEVANAADDSANQLQFCETGCQTDSLGEVGCCPTTRGVTAGPARGTPAGLGAAGLWPSPWSSSTP